MGFDALMPALSDQRIAELLAPYLQHPSDLLLQQLSTYLDLLLKWNARTNLTAIRAPEEIVQRHFGESLFAAQYLPQIGTLLDLGSGAGFPGLPMQLLRPELAVTLAESQNKKASFLREVVRVLNLPTTVWAKRSELLPPSARFGVVTLRAVDDPESALREARARLTDGGSLLHLGGAAGHNSVLIPSLDQAWLEIHR